MKLGAVAARWRQNITPTYLNTTQLFSKLQPITAPLLLPAVATPHKLSGQKPWWKRYQKYLAFEWKPLAIITTPCEREIGIRMALQPTLTKVKGYRLYAILVVTMALFIIISPSWTNMTRTIPSTFTSMHGVPSMTKPKKQTAYSTNKILCAMP